MNAQQVTALLNRYSAGECTPAERQIVDAWYQELINTGDLQWEEGEKELLQATLEARLLQSITDEAAPAHTNGRIRFMKRSTWWAAAAVVVVLAGAAYFLFNAPRKHTEVAKTSTQTQHDVAPGGNKAVLKLANGATIVLDDASNGALTQQGNSVVNKTKDGELKYQSAIDNRQSANSADVVFNTLSTPNGGQYQLVLADGSKVWLNAASSITFPSAFTGNERKVQITGEVYFEVAHNKKIPFIVNLPSTGGAGGGQVEVLGTHFNVNAYDDEAAIKTTLLEGKVKVESAIGNRESAILKPGEQAVLAPHSPLAINHSPDLDEVMAWKNGLFQFENADLKTVMRQLSRWYDVEVVYKGAIKNDPLFVELPRNTNLSDVLKALEISGGAKFRIEGKKIIVL